MERPKEKTARERTDERGAQGSDQSFAHEAKDAGAESMASNDTDGTRQAVDASDDSQADGQGAIGQPPPLAEAERQLADQRDKYLRLAAEYDNYRKRTAKERQDVQAKAQADLVKQLLDPIDDLARFAHVDASVTDPATIAKGVDMVERKLLKILTSVGLSTINPANQTFDPQVMEAVTTEPALSPEDDHVVSRVFQHGYLFNGQLLRPARVAVKQWTA